MPKEMTIDDVKRAKAELEVKILELLKQFESDTGVKITWVNSKIDHGTEDLPVCGANEKRNKGKGLYDIEIDFNLD